MRYMQGNRIILIGILLLTIVLVSGCDQVRTEAQTTLENTILARQMNRDGIFQAYERCNDLIDAEYQNLLEQAKNAKTPAEATKWHRQAADFLDATKRDLLTVKVVRAAKAGEVSFDLNCFGDYGKTEIEGLY